MKNYPYLHRLSQGFVTALALFWLAGACGGATQTTPLIGSESHFLMRCTDSCDSELSCIAGICTRSCIAGSDFCSDLASAAVCTNESVEPGAVAVCDVSCSDREDCAALGDGHVCDGGFCRLLPPSGARLSQLVCEEYLDQVPPPIELPGVTIINTGASTLYIQPVAPHCTLPSVLVGVQRVSPDGDRSDVNLNGCHALRPATTRLEMAGDMRARATCRS
jgi:hypothetical protein